MKKISLLLILFIYNFCLGQEIPIVQFVSKTNVVGTCNNGSIVTASYKIKIPATANDTTTTKIIKDTAIVKVDNKFNIKFTNTRDVDSKVSVWVKPKDMNKPETMYLVEDEKTIVEKLTINSTKSDSRYADDLAAVNVFKAEKEALKNTTLSYGAQVLSTNFTIPIARFNFVKNDTQKQGDILLFTSIGAGFGYYWGQLERTRDNTGEIINEEFRNRFGANLGFLFSAGTGEDTKNVFAPVINLAVLDFQIGIGVELGTRAKNQKKEFLTLSYAIPIYKLFKKGYKLYKITPEPNELIQKSLN